MKWAAAMAAVLVTQTAYADRDPAFEEGLVEVSIQGNEVMPGPSYTRPQLVYKDTTTGNTVGTIAAIGGTLSLAAGWVIYVARQNYRLTPRFELGDAPDTWRAQGMWAMSLAGFGAANLVASEYLLLPESRSVPTLAIIGGAAGVAVAAVGVGFMVGGTTCGPLAYQPGSEFPVACMSGTADAIFGPLLLMTAAPLLNWPLTYLLRAAFGGKPESLTFTPRGVHFSTRF